MHDSQKRPQRAVADDATDGPSGKRQKQRDLACRRCRARKQKCQGGRPCSNCLKSTEECLPTQPAQRAQVESEYLRALEERIAQLEAGDRTDHLGGPSPSNTQPAAGGSVNAVSSASSADRPADPARLRRRQPTGSPSPATPIQWHHGNQPMQLHQAQALVQARRSYSQPSPDDALSLPDDGDSEADCDHVGFGFFMSPSALEDGANLVHPDKPPPSRLHGHDGAEFPPHSLVATMPAAVEDLLLDTYRGRAQIQYPLFHWNTFLQWHLEWKNCPPSEFLSRSWQGFFVNLVYSTALLLLSPTRVRQSDARTFYNNGISLLRHVLRQHDEILRVQAYLLLSLQALHRSSTPRILSLVSTTMRLCVQLQLHLAETEMEPATPAIRFRNQIRRRCFWSAYAMDRLVMASFEMPPCLPDEMISSKLFANMDDDDLHRACTETPVDAELPDSVSYTCVSPSLHILQCRRIQSEICTFILRWDYKEHYENSLEWRIRILNELERYKARVKNFTDPNSKGHSSQRWLAMIYHYTLLLLYRPTKENVLGPAGDWAIQASSQACLIFRRSQMDRQVAQAWLGILVQFQSGVTLLYCCWSTPPEYRTDSYDSPDVSDALRACSNNLAIMADRWPKADCLRDVFELLAREVPLVDSQNRPPTRMSSTSAQSIKEKLPQVQGLIMHRTIIRMIGEMINDDFPRLHGSQPLPPPALATSRRATPGIERQPGRQGETRSALDTCTLPDILSFELPFSAQQIYSGELNAETSQLGADELLAFPGMFDVEGWS